MKIGILGLGYVGIQLAVGFGRLYETVGFDLDRSKIMIYQSGEDPNNEVSSDQLMAATYLKLTEDYRLLKGCDIFIVAVPTPVDLARNPDFRPLRNASKTVGKVIKPGAIVVYESTVYPGATEEVCVPELESSSGLTWKIDFSVGYSPERINPGDPDHNLATITKVVSADNDESLDIISNLYQKIVPAGIYRAPNIRVAEAAKVIENTQRDLNIALINELAVLFDRLEINTRDVLNAAASKWNFLPFNPGLVGGHCIGVDPYYLTHKAEMVGYHPEVILAGRRINDTMAHFVAAKTIRLLTKNNIPVAETHVNILGATFKEDCPDIRNSQVFNLVSELEGFGLRVAVIDPRANSDDVFSASGITLKDIDNIQPEPVTILAVPHREFRQRGFEWISNITKMPGLFVDIHSIFREDARENDSIGYWSL
tara:strand:+ start:959 stop:2236 length:1278 start_codon:yes stop_codon:yes gene_type:complete